uniref:Evasin n=1 Tax=Rhipicephalus pulchellus TaxID=72859 RepID=L7MC41_RHIPC
MNASVLSAICFVCFGLAIVTTIRGTYAATVTMGNKTINIESNSSDWDFGEYDYGNDVCVHDAVNSSCGPVAVGCNMTCLVAEAGVLPHNTLCVANASHTTVKQMPNYTIFTCLLGSCINGSCVSSGTTTFCEKFPVMTVSVANSSV